VIKIKSEMSGIRIGYSTWDMGQDENPTAVHESKLDVIDTRNDEGHHQSRPAPVTLSR